MQQHSIFDHATRVSVETYELFVDGASRGNPGPSGIGLCLRKDDQWLFQEGFFLGAATNNQAEYIALIAGVVFARDYVAGHGHLSIISDSQLLVRQLQGIYKVKDARLQILFGKAQALLQGMNYAVKHVLREHNTCADALANRGIDEKRCVPERVKKIVYT